MAEIKKLIMDITEEKSTMSLVYLSDELTIYCDNLDIRDLDDNSKVSVIENYQALFNHIFKQLNKLVDILDIWIFDAWDILLKYENLSNIDLWDYWENVESLEDLNIKIKRFSPLQNAIDDLIEKSQETFK